MIAPDAPVYATIMGGQRAVGEYEIAGVPYFAAFQPIQKMSGEVMGAIFVGTPMSVVEATANGVLGLILMVGGGVTVALAMCSAGRPVRGSRMCE